MNVYKLRLSADKRSIQIISFDERETDFLETKLAVLNVLSDLLLKKRVKKDNYDNLVSEILVTEEIPFYPKDFFLLDENIDTVVSNILNLSEAGILEVRKIKNLSVQMRTEANCHAACIYDSEFGEFGPSFKTQEIGIRFVKKLFNFEVITKKDMERVILLINILPLNNRVN